MRPSTADFSQIMELQQYRKLYEEQEEKNKIRLADKDGEIQRVAENLAKRDQQVQELRARAEEMEQQNDKLRNEYARLRNEAQEKIDKLSERIKELNQRLLAAK